MGRDRSDGAGSVVREVIGGTGKDRSYGEGSVVRGGIANLLSGFLQSGVS